MVLNKYNMITIYRIFSEYFYKTNYYNTNDFDHF